MEARIRRLGARLTCGYSEYEKLNLSGRNIRAKTWSECKDTPARKALTHSYSDLLRLLKALSMERESDQAADATRISTKRSTRLKPNYSLAKAKEKAKAAAKEREKVEDEAAANVKVE